MLIELNNLLSMLDRWELLQHDLGPDYSLAMASIHLFADGSGTLIAHLNRKSSNENQAVNNLLTSIGSEGYVERPFMFVNVEELVELLTKPIRLDYAR
jgi:hypothetical protein